MSSGTPHSERSRRLLALRGKSSSMPRRAILPASSDVEPEPAKEIFPRSERRAGTPRPMNRQPVTRQTAHQRRNIEYARAMTMRDAMPVVSSIYTQDVSALLEPYLTGYMRYQKQRSLRTIELRRMMIGRLEWFLQHCNHDECGVEQLEQFVEYLSTGHEDPDGRWGYEGEHHSFKPLEPVTILGYYRHLSSFFKWMVDKGHIDVSPFTYIDPPEARADQIIPFSDNEVESLLAAARHSGSEYRQRDKMIRLRNQAILLFLYSSGVRASELCELQLKHVEFTGRRAIVCGKGDRRRQVPFGENAETLLRRYLNLRYPSTQTRHAEDVLFASEGTCSLNDEMNRNSLRQMFWKLGKRAGLHIPKCSPHTMRHTFALRCAENGWDVFRLKEVMGHRDIATTMIYINLAHANPIRQLEGFLPGDNLKI
jgi:site-specific recombinase XerD